MSTIHGFEYKETVSVEPWMKRGAKVRTKHGIGEIIYVRKCNDEVLNFNVKVSLGLQYQNHQCAAWAVEKI